MDALALLCNLHADGPQTLQRLRRAGCESLAELAEMTAVTLAQELGEDEEAAERFQREAELLATRLEQGGAPQAATSSWTPQEPASSPREPEPTPDTGGATSRTEDVSQLLATWRTLDDQSPPEPPSEYVVPSPPPIPGENRALEEVGLDGMSPELAARFAEIGVLSLRGLVEASAIELARELPLPFTRVKRLQFLAGRAVAELVSAADATEARRAARETEGDRVETAGPFA